jgi:hypothetical protein
MGESAEPADYAIAGGILKVIRDADAATWQSHVNWVSDGLVGSARRGFAFNTLSLDSDSDRRRTDLHYVAPPQILAAATTGFGLHVVLLKDYGLWEFKRVARQPSQTASPNPLRPYPAPLNSIQRRPSNSNTPG